MDMVTPESMAPSGGLSFTPVDPASRWKPWTAPIALVAGLALGLVVGFVVAIVAAIVGASLSDPPAAVSIASTVGLDVSFIAVTLWLARRVATPRPEQFGLRATAIGKGIALVVGGYLLTLVIVYVWTQALDIHQTDKLPQQLGANDSTLALVAVGVLTCVVAPICEEFLFRGYMFRALRNWCGVWPAAIIVGVAFGAVHVASAPVGYIVPLAAFGVILCFVYEISGSLYPGIALHSLNNAIAFVSLEHGHGAGIYVAAIFGALAVIAAILRVAVRGWSAVADRAESTLRGVA